MGTQSIRVPVSPQIAADRQVSRTPQTRRARTPIPRRSAESGRSAARVSAGLIREEVPGSSPGSPTWGESQRFLTQFVGRSRYSCLAAMTSTQTEPIDAFDTSELELPPA